MNVINKNGGKSQTIDRVHSQPAIPSRNSHDISELDVAEMLNTAPGQFKVIRRNGKVTSFNNSKIYVAMSKAFIAVEGGAAAASSRVRETIADLTEQVVEGLTRSRTVGSTFHIEDIQDQVELVLMRNGHHKVARSYVLYREQRSRERNAEELEKQPSKKVAYEEILVSYGDDERRPLDWNRILKISNEACEGIAEVNSEAVIEEARHNIFNGINVKDLSDALIFSARSMVEKEPAYAKVAARLLLDKLRCEALSFIDKQYTEATFSEMAKEYPDYFVKYIKCACELELLDIRLQNEFDLKKLAAALQPKNDLNFNYLGLQTLYDRYFIHSQKVRFELPQAFFMRVAMGLAINEIDREDRAIEFYKLLSSFAFMSSTPTLFNSGTRCPQLSSCYLTTVSDDLLGIFGAIQDNAMLSKFAGGLGNDWSRVRAMGSYIKSTNGESQGIVPFLKVANDTAVAVNQGGKRKGAVCAYLETWHLDIEEFLELRKNTGDDRRRTHDMNTANWIPDLFMKRVKNDEMWTLFSPDEVADLHELYGVKFEKRYAEYESAAKRGDIKRYKRIKAVDLWRKMLSMLYETGHPWLTFKDPCNLRSPQQHKGTVHSSNLCTEITLNTSDEEVAVCNLGSVNLVAHLGSKGLDTDKLRETIGIAMRMLDNVIEYNYYSVRKARTSNLRHRPVGLGVMGFQDALYKMRIPYASSDAVEFADRSMEAISYYAIEASVELAKERGVYSTYQGSLWSQGVLPLDSMQLLAKSRGDGLLKMDASKTMDWDALRKRVKKYGMRNSNTMAIAPTATISNICSISQSIEPTYQNLYVKSNLSGEFTVINEYLVKDLKKLDLWDEVMVNDLKYYDGSIQKIERIPDHLKAIYATAFELDPRWLVEAASRRQKWIDQSESLNLYMAEPSGKKLDTLYKLAWLQGLKTTYYLRALGATHVEKSTMENTDGRLNAVDISNNGQQVCSVSDTDCDACQ